MKTKIKTTKALAGAVAMAAVATVGFALPSLAQASATPTDEVTTPQSVEAGDALVQAVVEADGAVVDAEGEADCLALFDELEDAVFEDWVPSAEEIAEINAETDALTAFLADRGHEVTVETDEEYGIDYVDLDPLLDDLSHEELDALLNEIFDHHYLDVEEAEMEEPGFATNEAVEGDLLIYEKETELDLESDVAIEAELTDLGIEIEDLEACEGIVIDHFEDEFGTEFEDDFDVEEFDVEEFEDWTPSAEEIAEVNAETDALAAFLADRGYEVTIETDEELGIDFVDIDSLLDKAENETDEDQMFSVLDEFFMEHHGIAEEPAETEG